MSEFGPQDDRLIAYYLARLAFRSKHSYARAFGLKTLYDFISDPDNASYLEKKTGFLPKDFMVMASETDIYVPDKNDESHLRSVAVGAIRYVRRRFRMFRSFAYRARK